MLSKYDVVVAGAGPAGAVAALYAALSGAHVLIAERDKEAGLPVRCAEGLLGSEVNDVIAVDNAWIKKTIYKAQIHAPSGICVHVDSVQPGYVLDRAKFDAGLVSLAVKAGADYYPSTNVIDIEYVDKQLTAVQLCTGREIKKINCQVLIAADGVESRLGRLAGLSEARPLSHIDIAVQHKLSSLDFDDDCLQFYFDQVLIPGGYAWIFPTGKQSANVGLAISGQYASRCNLATSLDNFISKHFKTYHINSTIYGGIPVHASPRQLSKNGVCLVGDAGGQVNPLTGGGLVLAMQAAKICGTAAGQAITSDINKSLASYDKKWYTHAGKELKFIAKMKTMFNQMSNQDLDEIFALLSILDPQDINIKSILKVGLRKKPLLLAELTRQFLMAQV